MRNDNTSNFAYVGPNDGLQQAPELYTAYRPANASDPTPIQPGETTQLRNAQTGLYCRLASFPVGFPLSSLLPSRRPPPRRVTTMSSPTAKALPSVRLQQTSSACASQGLLCDQPTISTATVLTYTGSGLSHNGVPLVESLGSHTLVLSSDPACTTADGGKLSFPPATLCKTYISAKHSFLGYAMVVMPDLC